MSANLCGPQIGAPGTSGRGRHVSLKGPVDHLLALILFAATLPLMLAAMVLVKLTSRGPAIYKQTRVGRHGRTFVIYKIRTMIHDCERRTGPQWASARDPRVTRVGRFLRRTHLDELPQLWNVLRGEMSLVGPRPERPEFVTQLERVIPFYRDRELILPGVTGLAQVQLPPDTDVAGVQRKLACDLYYIRRVSLWLDLRIVLSTAMAVVGIPCTITCRSLGIPTGVALDENYRDWSTVRASVARDAGPREGDEEPQERVPLAAPGWEAV